MSLFTALEQSGDTVGNYVISIGALVVAPVLIGRVIRNRAHLNEALREKAERLEARARRPRRGRGRWRSARGSPASCTTSSRTR